MTLASPLSPLALVAMAASPPAGEPAPFPEQRIARVGKQFARALQGRRLRSLPPPPCAPSEFRIPPIYERAVSALTLNLLWKSRMAVERLRRAAARAPDWDHVDVIVGVCGGFDSTLRNALKVAGVAELAGRPPRQILEGKRALQTHFGATTHDKVGEMGSIIAARIGLEIGAHGRILALESADATTFVAFQTAALGLTAGASDMAVVAIGQRFEGAHIALALGERITPALPFSEGATVFCLRRLDAAVSDGNPVLAVIDGFASEQDDRPAQAVQAVQAAPDRADALRRLARALPAARTIAADPNCADALGLAPPAGYGLAHCGAEALRDALPGLAEAGTTAILGRSLYGQNWAMRLRSADARAPARPAAAGPDQTPGLAGAPIAIVGLGAAFGPFVGRDAVLGAFGSGQDAIAVVSETALPRTVSFDPNRSAPLTSYAQLGSELTLREDAPRAAAMPHSADAAQRLAFAVGAEALAECGVPPASRRLRWSIVLACQLCTGAERALSNQVHRAELEALLGLPPAETEVSHPFDGLLPGETTMRLSQEFGLNAQGLVVESACASSLAALEIATRQLRQGLCDAVLVIGTELPINPRDLTLCSAQRMLSEDKIAPFAADADGFSPGDGAGAVVLRRLGDAQADGQPVMGVIRGVGGSSDAISFTAPDARGQISAMRRALADAGISPDTIGYVEAHGTGTRRGDGIEIEALNAVYAEPGADAAYLGSVKSMIGHCFAAAGMAGLIRALLAVNSGQVPPMILRRGLNPDLPLDQRPWRIAQTPQPWPVDRGPMRAAVNALGTGGTNFHLIVEAPPGGPTRQMEAL
jgi:acyl transferase domain-containing protein